MDINQHQEPQGSNVAVTNLKLTLPSCRTQWPKDAQEAFSGVLGDLNHWSRENDWPVKSNVRVAEEAIRQSWGCTLQLV